MYWEPKSPIISIRQQAVCCVDRQRSESGAQLLVFEVLDRFARMGTGLSPGQGNDWPWFKEAWDQAMLVQHGKDWAAVFSGWVQELLDDEGKSNAFSLFVYSETCRVFQGIAAIHVPGA